MDPEILPGSGSRKIQSRIRNKSFRIRNTGIENQLIQLISGKISSLLNSGVKNEPEETNLFCGAKIWNKLTTGNSGSTTSPTQLPCKNMSSFVTFSPPDWIFHILFSSHNFSPPIKYVWQMSQHSLILKLGFSHLLTNLYNDLTGTTVKSSTRTSVPVNVNGFNFKLMLGKGHYLSSDGVNIANSGSGYPK